MLQLYDMLCTCEVLGFCRCLVGGKAGKEKAQRPGLHADVCSGSRQKNVLFLPFDT